VAVSFKGDFVQPIDGVWALRILQACQVADCDLAPYFEFASRRISSSGLERWRWMPHDAVRFQSDWNCYWRFLAPANYYHRSAGRRRH